MTAGRRAVGVLAVALFAWWATVDGGYAPGAWYPGALLLLAALVALVRPRMYRGLPAPARWALAALAGFTLWSFCSIAWADARGDAWDGANRTLLYLSVFALFAMVPWSAREAAAWLGAFALAIAAIGVSALAGDDPAAFVDGRLAAPIGYENASAALFLLAFWAAVLVAARREAPWHARGLLLAAAGVLLDLTILAQSRGSLVAGLVTLGLALVLVPDRRPLLLALSATTLATAASLPALLGPYETASSSPDLVPVAAAMGASGLMLFAAGAGLGALERWIAERRRAVAAVGGLVALAAVGLALSGGSLAAPGGAADSRFAAGAGSGRYDFWRVAALEFARHPLTGVGADNFAHDYVRERRRGEEPLYPHSLALRALSQTGVVGAALLALFLATVVTAVRRLPAHASPTAVAAFVVAAAWLAHGSIDWLWEVPAVAAPAMAGLGLAAGLGARPAEHAGGRRMAAGAAVALVACAAAVSYALPALAAREIERAARGWSRDPGAALRGLERARQLNPLSDRPDLVAGALARRAGDREHARRAFLAALARDERNWHAHTEVALLDLRDGRRAAALARLARARALNPREPAIAVALEAAGRGEPPSPALMERLSAAALPGPIERRPVDCAPVLGLGAACAREEWSRWRS